MAVFAPEIVLVLLGIAAIAVLAVLGTLASLVRNSTEVHDLAVAASALRITYAKQMAKVEGNEVIEVDEVIPGAAKPDEARH